MMPRTELAGGTPALARLAWQTERLALGAALVLAFLTPSWRAGLFAHWPIAAVPVVGRVYAVGAFVLLLPVAGVAFALRRGVGRPAPHWRWGPWYLAVLVGAWGATVLCHLGPALTARQVLVAVGSVLVLWATYLWVLNEGSAGWGLGCLAGVLLCQALVGSAQFLRQGSIGLGFMGELALSPQGPQVSVLEAAGQRWLRAYGLSPHPNVLGGYLAIAWLYVLPFAARSLSGYPLSARSLSAGRGRALGGLGLLALGGLGLFFSFSRSAWLACAAGLGYMVLLRRPWQHPALRAPRVHRAVAVAAMLLVAILLVLGLTYRGLLRSRLTRPTSTLEERSLRERLEDVGLAWGVIRRAPLWGVGAGRYLDALWEQAGDDPPPGFRTVHNVPLLAAAELGLLGPLLWLALLLLPVLSTWRTTRRRPATSGGIAGAACLLAAAVISQLDSYLYPIVNWQSAILLGLLLALWAGAETDAGPPLQDRSEVRHAATVH